VEVGFTRLDVIEAATAIGSDTLGPQAPKSGQLISGYDADVLIVDGDPLADITFLAQPDHITDVWKAGTRVKLTPRSAPHDCVPRFAQLWKVCGDAAGAEPPSPDPVSCSAAIGRPAGGA
jgi:cytosine/adenosine deaminase-related metal-dependent hydrolase